MRRMCELRFGGPSHSGRTAGVPFGTPGMAAAAGLSFS